MNMAQHSGQHPLVGGIYRDKSGSSPAGFIDFYSQSSLVVGDGRRYDFRLVIATNDGAAVALLMSAALMTALIVVTVYVQENETEWEASGVALTQSQAFAANIAELVMARWYILFPALALVCLGAAAAVTPLVKLAATAKTTTLMASMGRARLATSEAAALSVSGSDTSSTRRSLSSVR